MADNPPAVLVEQMAQAFMRTDGDIRAVLHSLFMSHEFDRALGTKFKDPTRYVVSAIRFVYDGRPISNTRPVLNWLNGPARRPMAAKLPMAIP